ncbi:type I DNA topoisomerase [Vallicoccus soli]|uniref:DNA topoisomerase 1 n=1 Tax=Vallicoccus soli TaxID=2339232 RepID=A0A3A3ZM64_9ACTN|nr:type I DNA topoisomerase [Vallicoccus soli]RJK97695.1 type I DNA topoisomerase [Vallicoccus soli]
MAQKSAQKDGQNRTRRLVIVESPAKGQKIAGYLGAGYDVEASAGHIRDLPTPSELPPEMKKGPFGKFAVDVDNGFEPYYVVDADKKKKVSELRRKLKDADELLLATDDDREGEAIAWHLLQALEPKVPVRRMVFTEITKDAILRAVENTREIDQHRVDAQETRRILDRLYGYEVSPVLWRKVRAGLSAGRVQSVATRLVVQRERERIAFRAASYWGVDAELAATGEAPFTTRLVALDGTRVATGRDFGDDGQLRAREVVHLDEPAAQGLVAALEGRPFAVRSVEEKPYTRRPAAPFITSTLQQEASRKLRFSSDTTMRIAQRLYEEGYITYMRTDSTTLSQSALDAARAQARELYGADHVPDVPRRYEKKVKNAQEAHEAIRPAGEVFRTPGQVARELSRDEFALYELIWKRTIASQMNDARGSTATLRFGAEPGGASPYRDAEFSVSGTVITFRGFLAAYEEGRDEEPARDDSAEGRRLPVLAVGDRVEVQRLAAEGHVTSPPARYTEASLIKALEERSIGRPSTYSPTMKVILNRGYVFKKGSALVPTWLAFAVTRLLEEHFGELVDYDFTAEMEDDLDSIAGGRSDRVEWLSKFYFGSGNELGGLKGLVEDLGDIDARDINTVEVGEGIVLRVGRYGPYLERGDQRASVPDDLAPDELTLEKAEELLAAPSGDRELGTDPATGRAVVAKAGRFGPYVTEVLTAEEEALPARSRPKPRTGSLFTTMTLDTVTLDDALTLLTLPRVVGVDPADGQEITAQNGRYGPYLKKGTDSRTLPSEEQLLTITLDEALAVYAQPKQRGRGRAAAPPLRELGADPVSGAPILVKDGRFGPYVTDGETNATLRKGDAVESVTLERAAELLSEKRAKGPAPKKAAARKTAKAPAKKAAAKKAPARGAAAKGAAATTATTE